MQDNTIVVQFVPRMRFLVFDFGVSAGAKVTCCWNPSSLHALSLRGGHSLSGRSITELSAAVQYQETTCLVPACPSSVPQTAQEYQLVAAYPSSVYRKQDQTTGFEYRETITPTAPGTSERVCQHRTSPTERVGY
eukprot:915767-Rhodomonas_salina.1